VAAKQTIVVTIRDKLRALRARCLYGPGSGDSINIIRAHASSAFLASAQPTAIPFPVAGTLNKLVERSDAQDGRRSTNLKCRSTTHDAYDRLPTAAGTLVNNWPSVRSAATIYRRADPVPSGLVVSFPR